MNFKYMKILHCHGNHNLGDIMFNFIVLYNIKEYLEINNINIYFYMRRENIDQMNDFKPIHGIKLFDISLKPPNSIEIWDCNDYIFEPGGKKLANSIIFSGMPQNVYYVKYFNIRLNALSIPFSLTNFYYVDEDLLERFEKLDEKYKNIDILFINSNAMSGQYYYDENKWKHAIKFLNSKYKIVTTKKIDNNVLSTRDDNLKIKDIAAMSTKVKVVIAINTGVFTPLLNKYTLTNVKKFYIFDNRTYYNYPNFEMKKQLRDISLEDLDKYIN